MEPPITLLLADDHEIFLDGLKGILQQEAGFEVTGLARNGYEALDALTEGTVDVLITDINMPKCDGIALTQAIKAQNPSQKVLILSMYDDYSIIQSIFDAEAEGYVLKNSGRDELVRAIKRIYAGSSYYSKEVLDILMEDQPTKPERPAIEEVLSPRETEVLSLICQELSTKEIAEKLFLSPRTVDTHRKHILQKTGAKTLVGLVKFSFAYGLV